MNIYLFMGFLSVFSVKNCFGLKPTVLPKYLKRCKYQDSKDILSKCLGDAMEDALRTLKNGEPSLGIQPLDPLRVTTLGILQEGNRPVSISINHKNIDIHGVSQCKVLETDFDKVTGSLKGRMLCPHLKLYGDYELNGKVLVLPVRGKGKSTIILDLHPSKHPSSKKSADRFAYRETRLVCTFPVKYTSTLEEGNECIYHAHGREVERNGMLYVDYYKIDFEFNPAKMSLNFENLFDGDRTLGKSVNEFINENWREILAELKPSYEQVFSTVFKDTVHRVFSRIPVKNILPDYFHTASP